MASPPPPSSNTDSHYRSWADRVGVAASSASGEQDDDSAAVLGRSDTADTDDHSGGAPSLLGGGGENGRDDEPQLEVPSTSFASEEEDQGGCCAAVSLSACNPDEGAATEDEDLLPAMPEQSYPAEDAAAAAAATEVPLALLENGAASDAPTDDAVERTASLESNVPDGDPGSTVDPSSHYSVPCTVEEPPTVVRELEVIDLVDAVEPLSPDGPRAPSSDASKPWDPEGGDDAVPDAPNRVVAAAPNEDEVAAESVEALDADEQPPAEAVQQPTPEEVVLTDNSEDPSQQMDDAVPSEDSEEHEIEFGAGLAAVAGGNGGGADSDDPDLDALLASTTTDFAPEVDHSFDDLLDELLDDHHTAAQELETLMATTTTTTLDEVPHIGDVDEASKVVQPLQADEDGKGETTKPDAESTNPSTNAASTKAMDLKAAPSTPLRFIPRVSPSPPRKFSEDFASLQPVVEDQQGPSIRLSRPNLAARMTGTRRYTPPKMKKELKVVIPPPSDTSSTSRSPRKSSAPKAVSPAKSPAKGASPKATVASPKAATPASAIGTPSSATAAPAKKRSFLQTFTRALSSPRKPTAVPSPRSNNGAADVLPKLRPIDPHSRLLKETSASLGQRRDRFVPPPATFPSLSEVIRAIHSGAFDRKSSPDRRSRSPSRSPKHSRQ